MISKFTLAFSLLLLITITCLSQNEQPQFKGGDHVLVDVNMSSSPEYQKWRKATITKIHMWNGQVSGYEMKTDEGNTLVTNAIYMKKLVEAEEKNPNRPPEPEPFQQNTEFKVGDRVEVDRIMHNDPNESRWSKATVKAVDAKNRRYVVTLDESFLDMSILMRPDKIWIRPLQDGSRTPQQATCSFNVPPGTVTKTAKPSAALFKRVIYDWNNSIKRGSRLGITFEKFEMGTPYKNVLTQKGRLLDFIPTNAIVYPVKTKQIICEDHTTLIRRTLLEIEYDCYKNEFGDWVCKNGAPKKMESKSIYKE